MNFNNIEIMLFYRSTTVEIPECDKNIWKHVAVIIT